jgi:ATP-dependent exoDNAse (exonuclease V) beta subunit
MDLVWELPGKKCVLVDYKSFHGKDLSDIKAHAVMHGYPEQLKAYKETLEAAEYTVQDALIYYFVLGRVVSFDI